MNKMQGDGVNRVSRTIVSELDSFKRRFVPQVFESLAIPAFNFSKLVGPTPGSDVTATLNNRQKLLAKEPFVAYVRATETKKRKVDDTIISSEQVIYLFNRHGTAGIEPETPNARFIPNGTYLGELAEEDLGPVDRKFGPSDASWYLEIEILEKDRFVFDSKSYDATSNEFEFPGQSYLVPSLRDQLSNEEILAVEPWELLSDAFGLRDRPNLDKWQGRVSRLPLNSQLIFSGFPGTGKTTTMIRRLAFKSNPIHVDDYDPNGGSDLDSWVTFTPNDTLRSYLKEAMTREGLLAPSSKLRTWEDERRVLARDYLRIVNLESEATFSPIPTLNPGAWTDDVMWSYFSDFRKFLAERDGDLKNRARRLASIASVYRIFRRKFAEESSENLLFPEHSADVFDKTICDHEVDVLILSILETANLYFLDNKTAYYSSTNNELLENIKSLHRRQVAIDEAADFSTVEIGCMFQLAEPNTRSIMIVGDLMQRMTRKGISDWASLSRISNSFDLREFEVDYRLTRKLSRIASVLSNRISPSEADSIDLPYDRSPDPLVYKSTSGEGLGIWLEKRVLEIYKRNKGRLPTTAIITPNETDVQHLHALLRPNFEKHYIGIEACVAGQSSGEDSRIRIFSSQYIKGLEFDVVFFVNVDQFPDQELVDKYLYVGLTRARAFLGITYKERLPERLDHVSHFFSDGNWSTVG